MSRTARALLVSSLLVAVGLVVAFMLVEPPTAEDSTAAPVDPATLPVGEHDARIGTGEELVLVVFSDFECEGCGIIAPSLERLAEEYEGTVSVVHKHLPLSSHPKAEAAARAAEAAGEQGRFWEMHDLLFDEQDTWRTATDHEALFFEYATDLGLDVARFESDYASPAIAARIEQSRADGEELGVNLLPTVYVGGTPVAGAMTYRMLRDAIEQELDR